MRTWMSRFFMSERAATAIEYALIAGFLSIAIVTVVATLGSTLNNTFAAVAAGL